MSYIGTPPSNAFTSLLKQDFSTSATTGYTLDHAVNNANDIALFINFVRQEPTAGYAASGTSLVLTSATASSDDMYCVYLGQALQTVNPPNVSVGTAQLIDGAVTSAKLASGAVANTPAWYARRSAAQSISNQSYVKVQFDQEVLDTNSAYDNSSNYRWTCPSGQAGYYFIFGNIWMDSGENNGFNYGFLEFRKNGSAVAGHIIDPRDNLGLQFSVGHSFIQNVSVGDYYEVFAYISDTSASNITINVSSGNDSSNFGGYKIIT